MYAHEILRLDELRPSTAKELTRTNWSGHEAVAEWLTRHGFRQIGSGSYGSVWSDESRAVVKVFHRDPCYARFAAYCRDHRGNPHLPKISRVFPLPQDGGVVFMERLVPLPDAVATTWARLINTYKDFLTFRGYMPPAKLQGDAEAFARRYPALARTVREIVDLFEDGGCLFDIHEDNIMSRDGTVVIIDPVIE